MHSNHKRFSIAAIACGICVLLAGCLPFPLGNPENSAVDSKLGGYWYMESSDHQILMTLYPYDAHTYVLSAAEFKKEADKSTPQNVQLYKAWLTNVKGANFITLEPLAQHLPSTQDEHRAYIVARLVPEGDGLLAKGIDGDFEPIKSVKSAAELQSAIAAHLDDPKLYASDPTHYRHLDPEKDAELLKPLLELLK